jgi:p-hydroxybenzoate 3-monooxygenase
MTAIPKRTQVGIVGAGPAGLLLARLLHRQGIDVVVLENRSREYVEGRIRAGVMEPGTAALLDKAGAAERMRTEGLVHDGVQISFDGRVTRVDLKKYTHNPVFIYGQTEITKDLNALNLADGISMHFEARVTAISGLEGMSPAIEYEADGKRGVLRCDVIAGCDGYHGISRRSIPPDVLREYEKTYPFGWLGVLSHTHPASHELIYSNHERGFALCSQRSLTVSRNYIQVPLKDTVEQWSDTAFWEELRRRLPAAIAETLDTGPSTEKSIAPLRSYIAEPMRFGRLFLVGDAAHIVPPTGAKGLNLAASDAGMLASSPSAK